jgi:hypothetical protein
VSGYVTVATIIACHEGKTEMLFQTDVLLAGYEPIDLAQLFEHCGLYFVIVYKVYSKLPGAEQVTNFCTSWLKMLAMCLELEWIVGDLATPESLF